MATITSVDWWEADENSDGVVLIRLSNESALEVRLDGRNLRLVLRNKSGSSQGKIHLSI